MPAFTGTTRRIAPCAWAGTNRTLLWALVGGLLVHLFVVFSPWFKADRQVAPTANLTHIRLQLHPRPTTQAALPSPAPEIAKTPPPDLEATDPPAALDVPDAYVAEIQPDIDPDTPLRPLAETEAVRNDPGLAARIIAIPYLQDKPVPVNLFPKMRASADSQSSFHFRDRPNLDSVLNPVPEQLPFADGPRFVVDSYDPGVMGNVQRFWDAVTLEKEWMTKNGTKVTCAWILIIGGCGWD